MDEFVFHVGYKYNINTRIWYIKIIIIMIIVIPSY